MRPAIGLPTREHRAHAVAGGAIVAQRNWTEPGLDHAGALEHIAGFLAAERGDYELVGVGHRVVHGGLEFSAPVAVTAQVIETLERLVQLAPLHQPHSLSGMRYLMQRHPRLPQVACFDTAFHRGNPDLAQRFALPAELHEAGAERISTESSRVSAWKLATDEELMIARHTRDCIALLLPGIR